MNKFEIRGAILSVLFVAGEAVEMSVFTSLLNIVPDTLETVVMEMMEEMQRKEEGILLVRVGNKLQLRTNEKYAQHIKEVLAPDVYASLSASVMEALSIIAYRQPVTRGEIDEVRGVNSNYAVSALMEKGLIREAGRKDVLGRPALLVTTDEFLRHFGISSLAELPALELFEEQGDKEGVPDAPENELPDRAEVETV